MVTRVFEHYGEISGVFVIRSTDGYRKGCAFVKFVNRADAYNAIAAVNGKVIFQEDNRPLIVKIADTRGEKKMRMNQNRRDGHHGEFEAEQFTTTLRADVIVCICTEITSSIKNIVISNVDFSHPQK